MDRSRAVDNVQQNFEDNEEFEKLELLAEEIAELTNRIAELTNKIAELDDESADESADELTDERCELESKLDDCLSEFSYLSEACKSDIPYILDR